MLRNVKFLFVILAVLVIAGSAYAFAAANTVADSNAGYAASLSFSGYDVTAIAYDSVDADPTKLAKISFTLEPKTANIANLTTVKISTTRICLLQDSDTSLCAVTGT